MKNKLSLLPLNKEHDKSAKDGEESKDKEGLLKKN